MITSTEIAIIGNKASLTKSQSAEILKIICLFSACSVEGMTKERGCRVRALVPPNSFSAEWVE